VAGEARTGIWLDQEVELVDVGEGAPTTRLFTLDDKPVGSAAVLAGATTSTATFTPDVPGTYKFSLAWNGDVDNAFTRVVRVTKSAEGVDLDILILPAHEEEAEHSEGISGQGATGRGWTPLVERVMAATQTTLVDLTSQLVMDRDQLIDASGVGPTMGTPWVPGLAASGHVPGTKTSYYIKAYTRSLIVLPEDFGVTFVDGTPFDPAQWDLALDTVIELRRVFDRTIGTLTQVGEKDTTAPRIVKAYVDIDDPDVVVVRFDRGVIAPTSGDTSVTGKTITGIKYPDTSPEVRYQLNSALTGDLDAGVVHVTFGAANTVKDLNGNALPAQTIGVFWWRDLIDIPGHTAHYKADDYVSTSWDDVASIRTPLNASGPVRATNAIEGAVCVSFDGVNDVFSTADTLEAYVDNTDGIILFGGVVKLAHLNGGAGQPVNNDQLICQTGTGQGFAVDSGADGDSYELIATCYSVSPYLDGANVGIQRGQPFVGRNRHSTTSLWCKRDRFAESSATTTGNITATMASGFTIGGHGGGDRFPKFYAGDIAFFDAPLDAQNEEAAYTYLELRPWAHHLRHTLLPPIDRYAVVGVAMEMNWEHVMSVPTPAFNSSALSQYTFAVTGLPTAPTVTTTKMSWTPGSAHVGTHTATVTATLGNRVVATARFSVHVSAATGTGTIKILIVGDSRTEALTWPKRMVDQLTAQGLTVTMLGSRGGRLVTAVNSGTDRLTITGHSLTVNEPVDLIQTLTGGAFPTVSGDALAVGTTYYVKTVVDANTVELSRTAGGAILDFTSTTANSWYVRAADERNEGRAGWSWSHYVVGDHPTQGTSPFLDADGAFSVQHYIDTYLGGVVPDVIIWALNVNGIYSFSSPQIAGVAADDPTTFRAFIKATQIAHAEVAIAAAIRANGDAVQLVEEPETMNLRQAAFDADSGGTTRWQYKRGQEVQKEMMRERFGSRALDNVWLWSPSAIDTYSHFDAANGIHPNDAGYTLIGDEAAAATRFRLAA